MILQLLKYCEIHRTEIKENQVFKFNTSKGIKFLYKLF